MIIGNNLVKKRNKWSKTNYFEQNKTKFGRGCDNYFH